MTHNDNGEAYKDEMNQTAVAESRDAKRSSGLAKPKPGHTYLAPDKAEDEDDSNLLGVIGKNQKRQLRQARPQGSTNKMVAKSGGQEQS